MLYQRLLFGSLMIAAIVALLWGDWRLEQSHYFGLLPGGVGGGLFTLLIVGLIAGGSAELGGLARAKGLAPLTVAGAVVAAALAAVPFAAQFPGCPPTAAAWVVALGTLLIFAVQAVARRTANAIPNLAATALIVLYLGALAMFALRIRLEFATTGLLLYLAAIKFTDIGAYAVGKLLGLGRHKIAPAISPGKSWEGLAGGVVFSAAVTLAIALPTGLLGAWQALVFAAVMAPAGQAADMAESLLKRDAGRKDSGHAIPGFGGLLDVLDSPLGAAPVGFLMLMLLH